jgi:hypothetical protein
LMPVEVASSFRMVRFVEDGIAVGCDRLEES